MAQSAREEIRESLPRLSDAALTEVLLAEAGARDLVRVSCTVGDTDAIGAALRGRGLHARRWEGTLRPDVVSEADDYVVSSRPEYGDASESARTLVFVARDPDLADLAVRFAVDDPTVGALLGYPACCVRAFMENRDHHLTSTAPVFAGHEPSPYWTNTMLDAFGLHLVSHFPCSPGCAGTHAIARRNLAVLAEVEPALAVETVRRLSSIVLLHGRFGLLYGRPHPGGGIEPLGASPAWRTDDGLPRWVDEDPAGGELKLYDFTGAGDGGG